MIYPITLFCAFYSCLLAAHLRKIHRDDHLLYWLTTIGFGLSFFGFISCIGFIFLTW